jgi:RNA polymerase sigma factor for flagellar operon FliA
VVQRKKQLREARRSLFESQQREPTKAEMASHLNIHEAELRAWEEDNAGRKMESLDELTETYGMWFVDSAPSPDAEIEREQLAEKLAVALASLDQRLQLVMQLYYVEELNLREIAEVMGVSVGRVSQLKTEAAQQIHRKLSKDFALN